MNWLAKFLLALAFLHPPFSRQIPLGGITAGSGGSGCTAGGSSPTIVQGGTGGGISHAGSASTVNTATSTGSVTGGDQLFVFAYCSTGARTLSVSDSFSAGGSNAWVTLESNLSASPAAGEWSLFGVASSGNCVGGCNDTITVTVTGGTCADLNAGAMEATNTSTTVDQGPGSASGLNSNNVTTLFANELALGLLAGGNGGTNPTQGTGWTLLGHTNAGGTNPGFEGKALSSCSTLNAIWTGGTGTLQSNIITIKHN